MSFANEIRKGAGITYTENGAAVHKSTDDAVLNLFARIGGLRKADKNEIETAWLTARAVDKELADNMILYARDIRFGGIGERRIGRILLRLLADKDAAKVKRNFDTIVSAGRFDDLWSLEGTSVETEMLEFMRDQFKQDLKNMGEKKPISLLAKWMPSVNTSSAETRRLGRKFATFLGLSERTYRKTLSEMRKYLEIVERKMSAGEFSTIDYEFVPSVAMTRYRSAFGKHDFERFDAYLNAVTGGKAKINASVSYPYDLIMPYVRDCDGSWCFRSLTEDKTLEAQWKALPNYVESEGHNVIVMADVSGSMTCDNSKPLATSISLGIYFAERNTGEYQNLLMTFTDDASLYELDPNQSVAKRVEEVCSHVGYNTNLDKAFKSIYNVAKRCGEAPEALVVISDSEIDCYASRLERAGMGFEDIAEKWQRKYAEIGLTAPKLIMWNVESRAQHYIAKKTNKGVAYVSGSSASTFKELTTLITMDAVEAMTAILTKPQFQWK